MSAALPSTNAYSFPSARGARHEFAALIAPGRRSTTQLSDDPMRVFEAPEGNADRLSVVSFQASRD